MEKFYAVLKEFKTLLFWPLGASGIGPTMAHYTGLLPVGFLPIAVLSSVSALVSVCWVFFFLSRQSKKTVGRVLNRSIVLGAMGFLLYSILFFQFTYVVKNVNNDRVVLGCGWTPQVLPTLKDYKLDDSTGCPGEGIDVILGEFNHLPEYVWGRSGRTIIQLSLGGSFVTFFVSLSVFLSSFIVFQVSNNVVRQR